LGEKSEVLRAADLTLDMDKRQIRGRGGTTKLTPKECQLLVLFMTNPGKVLSRRFLMKRVWETDYVEDTRTLEVHICRLRRKIEKASGGSWCLKTVRGVGYRLELGENPPLSR